MTIPGLHNLMMPVLRAVAAVGEMKTADLVGQMADEFNMTAEERKRLLPSGQQTIISNRTHWAVHALSRKGLLERTRRAHYRISKRGREALATGLNPERHDQKWYSPLPDLKGTRAERDLAQLQDDEPVAPASATPDEVLRAAHAQIEDKLRSDLLDLVVKGQPAFFEHLIGRLALALGYGGGRPESVRVIGRSGDRGIDVEIDEDALGLDKLMLQAKRYTPGTNVTDGDVRDFAGALQLRSATKGVIATTSAFTQAARASAERLGIVLIDGDQLATLMIRYDVGVRIEETFHIKKVDEDFFSEE